MTKEQIEAKAQYDATSKALREASAAVASARVTYDLARQAFLKAESNARKLGAI